MATISAQVVREHGATRVTKCWLDESGPDASTYHGDDVRLDAGAYSNFLKAAGAGPDDTVVMSWVEWPDKATRDAGMAKVTGDPRMRFNDMPPVFDGARLIAGSFQPMPTDQRFSESIGL
ncbi:DUF1428 domain-containing protein [Hydrogenophaga laconesensis]|uniref:Uncharacterized protein YbaA (DUF1428 family) n=1 Tax=Hydrogenophaga laconesensis TaxID=1805971 RepID=A0ABU1VE88_9BURK|nr:DUF1428 domain-containing protein [Hydrogenophaga laconesensis]MDR7095791.1 uncharacterized protein YbaA (DUF1428 family) [Hydrogenophaga laconesensis]